MPTDTSKIITTDDRGRTSLGALYADRLFLREDHPDGSITLAPAEVVARQTTPSPLPESLKWTEHPELADTAIYLGEMSVDGKSVPYAWDPTRDAHIRFVGATGSGLTSLTTPIIRHLAEHPDQGSVHILDPKGYSYDWAAYLVNVTVYQSPTAENVCALADHLNNLVAQRMKDLCDTPGTTFAPVFIIFDLFNHLERDLRTLPTEVYRVTMHTLRQVLQRGRQLGIQLVFTGNPTPDFPFEITTILLGSSNTRYLRWCDMDEITCDTNIRGRGLLHEVREAGQPTVEFQAAYMDRER